MNLLLKILAAIALIMVILSSGGYLLKNLEPDKEKNHPAPPVQAQTTSVPAKELRVADELVPPPKVETKPLTIKPDNPLQPNYRPINQPAYLQFLRQAGKTYHSTVAGKISGKASKRDWGLEGVAHFTYVFTLDSKSKIISNNGVDIIEERSFKHVQETLLASRYEVGLEMPDGVGAMLEFLSQTAPSPKVQVGANVAAQALKVLNHKSLTISKEWLDLARSFGMFKHLPDLDPNQLGQELRLFTQGDNNRLLEGKTVRIHFVDGHGITKITPLVGGLSQKEEDLIVRTNFVMDHYLFPDRKVEPGSEWEVPGDVFAGFLDPRLQGKPEGSVTVLRTPDSVDPANQVSRRLRIINGQIKLRNVTGDNEITGQITGLKGVCAIPEKHGVVTSAFLSGYADYKNLSRDHLLFQAATTYTPKIEIRYECNIE